MKFSVFLHIDSGESIEDFVSREGDVEEALSGSMDWPRPDSGVVVIMVGWMCHPSPF